MPRKNKTKNYWDKCWHCHYKGGNLVHRKECVECGECRDQFGRTMQEIIEDEEDYIWNT